MSTVRAVWRKSSYSGNTQGNCVEAALLVEGVGVRDSKAPLLGDLTVEARSWASLVTGLKR
ncbi:DUF397 domain-containing protein [Yinghuangia seranimata]|uniref:DUF397 domain-containing protein n=1 Tax=Yinghuangia seranimata TaxID=408067 RepID=UPI00248BB258|nr:DUF397 domain-containing protein [Yinghuangia seranimata]MDI2126573.1 DUF397 domain-containing protein [Yinghuangia seranimata]